MLVADDDEPSRGLLAALLRQVGFAVREAVDGAEAVDLFRAWSPHFIWMDMRMPVLDGRAAVARIRALPGGKAVKIVAVTANVFEAERARVCAGGCDDMLGKPYRTQAVFQMLEKHLGARYVYRQADDPLPSATPAPPSVCADDLRRLPQDLVRALRHAVLLLEMDKINAAIEQIGLLEPRVAGGLQDLADKFDYEPIHTLCEQSLQDADKR